MALTYLSPQNGATVPLHTAQQKEFIRADRQHTAHLSGYRNTTKEEEPLDWLHPVRSGNEDFTIPRSVQLLFKSDKYPVTVTLTAENGEVRTFRTDTGNITVDNLLADTYYTWRAEGDDKEAYFYTASDVPRFITVNGISNVRDIGGFPTVDGHTVKQGCIYRGSEMDTHHTITADGIRTMRDVLHIETDLDLRGEAVGRVKASPLGCDVNFTLIPTAAYADFMAETQKITVYRLFSVLADEADYPIYFHCWGGADRTGTLAFFLEALLGVPDELLFLDYELTSLSIWGARSCTSELFSAFLTILDGYAGDTYGARAVSFLKTCNISDTMIAHIRENLLI